MTTGGRPETDERREAMRRAIISVVAAAALVGVPGVPGLADVSHTQHLPTASCNQGTMNAHANIPEPIGTGTTTTAHGAVPGDEFVSPCGHGG